MSPDPIDLINTELLSRFTVTNYNDSLLLLRRPRIQGVEVTQAIQYYRSSQHLTDPADRAPDNAVTLIAGKPAWVRVYLRAGFLPFDIRGVTGTIEVQRRRWGFIYAPVTTLSPEPPGSVTARHNPTYTSERGTLTHTLNFILPANVMCGFLRLVVHVVAPDGKTDDFTIDLDVTLQQTLRMAGIMVGYNGPNSSAAGAPNITLAAPTLADLQTTSGWTLRVFPVRSFATYRIAGTVTWNRPLTDAPTNPGGCSPNWLALNGAVQAQRIADGNRTDVLYYGLMANGIPMGPVIGCNTGSVSTGANGNGVTMAHELGHACRLPHAPCGTPGDPNYPAYEPYDPAGTPQASIGEYGLDISNGNIMVPAIFKDLMSYCGPRWISLYNYGRLTNNTNLAPVRTCVDYPWWRDIVLMEPVLFPERWLPDPPPDPIWRQRVINPEPLISIIGVVHSEKEIEIQSIMRVETMREVVNGKKTDLVAELLGGEQNVVASAPLYQLQSHGIAGCGCSGEDGDPYPYVFQALVPDSEPGSALRIRRGDEELWTRDAPEATPVVSDFKVRVTKARKQKQSQLIADWQVKSSTKQTEAWLQWSKDGETWYALTTGLRGKRASLDISGLPVGTALVRLLMSDGYHTVVSEPTQVEVPAYPPETSILSPLDGHTFVAGNSMRLWGVATGNDGEPVADEKARWLVDGKEVAQGMDAFIPAPRAGEHRLTLIVAEDAKKAERSIRFNTVQVPSEEEENQGL